MSSSRGYYPAPPPPAGPHMPIELPILIGVTVVMGGVLLCTCLTITMCLQRVGVLPRCCSGSRALPPPPGSGRWVVGPSHNTLRKAAGSAEAESLAASSSLGKTRQGAGELRLEIPDGNPVAAALHRARARAPSATGSDNGDITPTARGISRFAKRRGRWSGQAKHPEKVLQRCKNPAVVNNYLRNVTQAQSIAELVPGWQDMSGSGCGMRQRASARTPPPGLSPAARGGRFGRWLPWARRSLRSVRRCRLSSVKVLASRACPAGCAKANGGAPPLFPRTGARTPR